jgi:hypothetical protein
MAMGEQTPLTRGLLNGATARRVPGWIGRDFFAFLLNNISTSLPVCLFPEPDESVIERRRPDFSFWFRWGV